MQDSKICSSKILSQRNQNNYIVNKGKLRKRFTAKMTYIYLCGFYFAIF